MSQPTLRPATDSDTTFLLSLYAETRAAEMAMVPWNDELKRAFVESQFNSQHAHYKEQFPDAAFDIILLNGEPVGRLYVLRAADQIRILDIHVTEQRRGGGIGRHFITSLQEEAKAANKPLRIYLEVNNPYMAAFEKRGFARIDTLNDFHVLMEWRPTK